MVCRHHLQSISNNIFRILVEYVTILYVRLCWRSKWKCMCDAHTLAHSVKCSKLIGFFFLFCAIQILSAFFQWKNWFWRLIAGATNHPISQYSTKISHILSNPIFYSVIQESLDLAYCTILCSIFRSRSFGSQIFCLCADIGHYNSDSCRNSDNSLT